VLKTTFFFRETANFTLRNSNFGIYEYFIITTDLTAEKSRQFLRFSSYKKFNNENEYVIVIVDRVY